MGGLRQPAVHGHGVFVQLRRHAMAEPEMGARRQGANLRNITPYGGYNGDEDQGQMGALGVMMAIGLFDEQGGAALKPTYQITSPVFDRVTIHLIGTTTKAARSRSPRATTVPETSTSNPPG